MVVMENESDKTMELQLFPTMQSDEEVTVTIDTPRLTGSDLYFEEFSMTTGLISHLSSVAPFCRNIQETCKMINDLVDN